MRFATASLLATFAILIPVKLQALEIAPVTANLLHQPARVFADPTPAPQVPAANKPESNARASHENICATVAAAATANDLPIIFFLRLIWHESRFDPLAISHAGAVGVAQFMPKIASAIGLLDPFDPAQALPASARFLSALHQKFGNLGLAAAAYNAGSRRIRDWLAKRGELPRETRNYVVKVTGLAPELWAKAAPDTVALEMPPVSCPPPEALVVRAAIIPLPPQRPREAAASDISAAAAPAGKRARARDDAPSEARAANASTRSRSKATRMADRKL